MARILIMLLVFIVSGCAATSFKNDAETVSPGQTMVFGKVQVFSGDEQKETRDFWGGVFFRLLVRQENTAEIVSYEIMESGFFFWDLPPGDYSIVGHVSSNGNGRLGIDFTVPPNVKGIYIGDLILDFDGSYYSFGVKDNYAEALGAFNAKLPGLNVTPERLIAETEKAPGTYENITYVCSDDWGIECTRHKIGVKSKNPEGGQDRVVDSTTPTLEWYPSKQPDVTYDVVIYEVVKFPRNEAGLVIDSMPGKLVHYSQGLTKPVLKLTKPLQTKTQYYWTVRLRKGETVSTWSSYGYFNFFLIGWVSGHGMYFSFTTPG